MGVRTLSPLVRGLALLLVFSTVPVTSHADLRSDFEAFQEARIRNGITALDEERRSIQARFSAQEMDCLDRFLSASCLEDVRQGHARALRELELIQESLQLQIRQIQASARQRARQEAVAQHTQAIEQRRAKP